MPHDEPVRENLFVRYRTLGAADRSAVLERLEESERAWLHTAIEREEAARQEAAERGRRAGRQFDGYSPWLARLVEQVMARDPACDGVLTAATRERLAELHEQLRDDEAEDPHEPRWQSFLRELFLVRPAKGVKP